MAKLRFFAASAVLCSLVVLGQGVAPTTEKPVTLIVPLRSSAEPSTNSTTTQAPKTTVPTSMTTTPPPTTTTPPPTTTTPPPTTSTTAPTTTTLAPTTTTPAPTPAPKPKPIPPPEQGKWHFTEKNVTCIAIQFAAQLNVTYPMSVGNDTKFEHVIINVPANASAFNGSCAPAYQWITLSWWPVHGSAACNLTLAYSKNDTAKEYQLQRLQADLIPELFVNASGAGPFRLRHGAEWALPLATSYRCAGATRLPLAADAASVVANLTLTGLQEEAYRTTSQPGFSHARECGGGDVPDAVPIAVGCALAALVLVVLVAYLVARRRSAAAGYLSM